MTSLFLIRTEITDSETRRNLTHPLMTKPSLMSISFNAAWTTVFARLSTNVTLSEKALLYLYFDH